MTDPKDVHYSHGPNAESVSLIEDTPSAEPEEDVIARALRDALVVAGGVRVGASHTVAVNLSPHGWVDCLAVARAALSASGLLERERVLREALEFYADPETYHAMLIIGDRPCGEFAEDFSEDHGHEDYDRPMPGKLARETLTALSNPLKAD